MSARFPRLVAAVALFAGALTVGIAAPAFAENSPTSIPIAVDDSYGMTMGTTLTVDATAGLLVNDLHAAAWTIIFVEAVQNDVPGELTLESVYQNGAFTYTPDPAFSGVRTFQYQVRDGDLGVVSDNWATVSITVIDPSLPCLVGTPGCQAPDPGPGDLPPCDPNGPIMEAPQPGTPPTCIPGDLPPCDPNGPIMEVPQPGTPPTCIPGDLPPCDPNGPIMEVPQPGTPPTCIPGDPTPGDGSDIPCAVGAPGCPPPADVDIPTPTNGDGDGTITTTGAQLETLAYTGSSTVDYRLAGLAALLLVGGVLLLIPRRKAA